MNAKERITQAGSAVPDLEEQLDRLKTNPDLTLVQQTRIKEFIDPVTNGFSMRCWANPTEMKHRPGSCRKRVKFRSELKEERVAVEI